MSVTYQSDHVAAALARRADAFTGIAGLEAAITIFAKRVQEVEDALWQLMTLRDLNNAVGEPLDVIGRILNETRDGQSDDDFRHRLRAKIRVLRSSGSAQDFLDIFKLLLPNNLLYFDGGHAGFVMRLGQVLTQFLPIYQRFMYLAKTAGVNGQGLYWLDTDAATFELEDAANGTVIADNGLGDANDLTVGGTLAGVFKA